MFMRGLLLLLGPIVAFAVYAVFVKKFPRVALFTGIPLSCLSALAALFIVGRLVVIGSRMPPSPAVINNLISAGESLPAREPVSDSIPLLRAAFSSDPHWEAKTSSEENRTAILNQVEKRGYDAFFILGDIGERGDWYSVYETACTDINMLVPDIPVRLLMGNHDAAAAASVRFRKYFYGRAKAPLNYVIEGGHIHFVILNLLWGAEGFTPGDYAWLEKQLKSFPRNDTVVVLSHCFYVSSGFRNNKKHTKWYDMPSMINKFCPLFEKYHVDLVISGHNHMMEILKKDDVTYAVCGAMGGKLDDRIDYVSPYDIWHDKETYGFIDASFYQNRIELAFIDSNGESIKEYTVKTH